MPTNWGQTGWRHDDYKVQREFERISRQTSIIQETLGLQQTQGGGQKGSLPGEKPKPTLWALTTEHNGNAVGPNDEKVVQVLNFKDYHLVGTHVPIRCDVKWKLERDEPKSGLKTITNASQTNIEAYANLDVGDLNKWLEREIWRYLSEVNNNIDGGFANSVYLTMQSIDGGEA